MFRRGSITWSPIEEEYLKTHRTKDINQLTIALAKSRAAIKRKCDEFDGKSNTVNKNKRSAIGKREDLKGQFFRSGWEANIARVLNYKKIKWEFEPVVFSFLEHGIKRGTVSYCPDFKWKGVYLEVKGYLDSRGRTAIRRFKKYYPEEFKKLKAIVGSPNTKADKFFKELEVPIYAYMRDLDKEFKNKLKHWE
jgi:hypothetical protein